LSCAQGEIFRLFGQICQDPWGKSIEAGTVDLGQRRGGTYGQGETTPVLGEREGVAHERSGRGHAVDGSGFGIHTEQVRGRLLCPREEQAPRVPIDETDVFVERVGERSQGTPPPDGTIARREFTGYTSVCPMMLVKTISAPYGDHCGDRSEPGVETIFPTESSLSLKTKMSEV